MEDDWESPTLGAWGLGWEVWLDGMEITQFTYFQQVAGMDLEVVSLEITYGLERIAMFLQGVDDVFRLEWAPGITYGELHREAEVEFSRYNFEEADVEALFGEFRAREAEGWRLLQRGLVLPAYEMCMRCSHLFNLLDARRAISVAERTSYITRVRNLARGCAERYLEWRSRCGFPLLRADAAAAGDRH